MPSSKPARKQLILVTGATGYVGGRLVPHLLKEGYRVRVLVRGDCRRLNHRPWCNQVEVVSGDALQVERLSSTGEGVDAAYYLIHTMHRTRGFTRRNVRAAHNFGSAAAAAGVKRIVYLSGLGDRANGLSEHLRSRQETGEALRQHGIPVTEFRVGMIVGPGSLAFEMIRHLTERLPLMICPRWVFSHTQPIAIRDVLSYLVSALRIPESEDQIIEIGSTDVLTYADMMRVYGRLRGLRRLIIPVPVVSPRLSSFWVHWITPVPESIADPLIRGLYDQQLVRGNLARKLFPDIQPLRYEEAVALALRRMNHGDIETIWSDSLSSSRGDMRPVYLTQEQGMLIERRHKTVASPPDVVFKVFSGFGGERGWPAVNWLWRLRGVLDRLVGGVGMRRGRRHRDELREGEALDFWRVEAIEPGHLLRLRAEMKLPGQGWLQFEAESLGDGQTKLRQTAYFASRGLSGVLYWYALYPVHRVIFGNMIESIARRAEAQAGTKTCAPNPQNRT